MQIILIITLGWLIVRLFTATKNWWDQPFLEEVNTFEEAGRISVLIPARNEVNRLPLLLSDLKASGDELKEILVLDDGSTDRTEGLVKEFQATMPNLKLIKGRELPEGWVGKNWACHQLAQEGSGNYYLFLDADVRIKPNAVKKGHNAIQNQPKVLLTVFARQEMRSIGEKAIVPLIPYILLTQLPLNWVYSKTSSVLAAANGQFMLFDAQNYEANKWHWQLKNSKAEDIDIAKQIKKSGYKVQSLLSRQLVECRMYSGFKQGLEGFAKNFPAFFLNNWLLAFGFALMTGIVYGGLAFSYPVMALVLFLVEVLAIRTLVAYLGKLPLLQMILWAPVHMVTVLMLAIFAAFKNLIKKQEWKGRPI